MACNGDIWNGGQTRHWEDEEAWFPKQALTSGGNGFVRSAEE